MVDVFKLINSKAFTESEAVKDVMDTFETTDLTYNNDEYADYSLMEACELDCVVGRYPALDWGSGATKVVVIFKTFVLKCGYTSVVNWNEDEDGWIDYDNPEYEDWGDVDYCDVEACVYKKAVEAGVARFFAPTVRVSDTDVFIQPKCDMTISETGWDTWGRAYGTGGHFSNYEKRFGVDAVTKVRKKLNLSCIPMDVFAYWLDTIPYMQLMRLGEFLEKHRINDLHCSNIGWYGDEIRLFDYSGYRSGTAATL